MKRQGLIITIKELENLIKKLKFQNSQYKFGIIKDNIKFQVNIINLEGLSDTWQLE